MSTSAVCRPVRGPCRRSGEATPRTVAPTSWSSLVATVDARSPYAALAPRCVQTPTPLPESVRCLVEWCIATGPQIRTADLVAREGAQSLARTLLGSVDWQPPRRRPVRVPMEVRIGLQHAPLDQPVALAGARFGRIDARTLLEVGKLVSRESNVSVRVTPWRSLAFICDSAAQAERVLGAAGRTRPARRCVRSVARRGHVHWRAWLLANRTRHARRSRPLRRRSASRPSSVRQSCTSPAATSAAPRARGGADVARPHRPDRFRRALGRTGMTAVHVHPRRRRNLPALLRHHPRGGEPDASAAGSARHGRSHGARLRDGRPGRGRALQPGGARRGSSRARDRPTGPG